MITNHAARGLTWLDLESPTEEEIAGLIQRYGISPMVGEQLKSGSSSAKLELSKGYAFVVLTLPSRLRKGETYSIVDREADFIIGRDFLITSHSGAIEQLEYFSKLFEANSILHKNERPEHPAHLFYLMAKRIYAGMRDDLENIRDSLLAAEDHIFQGDERRMVEALSGLSRELIDFRQTARVHREVWEEMLEHSGDSLFGADFAGSARDLRDEFNAIHELAANARELLSDLRETNDSLLNTKQNDITRTLTVVAFVFYPATFVAAIFTIPADQVPLVRGPYGWIIILALIAAIVVVIWASLKRKRWL